MTKAGTDRALRDLEELLDAYGAEPMRWPPGRREAAERLVASDPRAGRLVAEARALDTALASASAPDPARLADLSSRILAAAAAAAARRSEPARGGGVVPIDPRPRRPEDGLHPSRAAMAAIAGHAGRRGAWTSGVLAASLALGILIGGFAIPAGTVGAFGLGDRDQAAELVAAVVGDTLVAVLDEELQ